MPQIEWSTHRSSNHVDVLDVTDGFRSGAVRALEGLTALPWKTADPRQPGVVRITRPKAGRVRARIFDLVIGIGNDVAWRTRVLNRSANANMNTK